MAADESLQWKIIDILFVIAIFLAAMAAVQVIFDDDPHIHLKNTKDVNLFRDAALASPNKLINATFIIPEELVFKNDFNNKCNIGFEIEGKPLYEQCSKNENVKIVEWLKQPDLKKLEDKEGEYKINVNV